MFISKRGGLGKPALRRVARKASSLVKGDSRRKVRFIAAMTSRLEKICAERGLKMTDQRRVISQVLSEAHDHPDVEQIYRRASAIDPKISIATVYRTMRLYEDANIIERLDFRDGRARYEENREEHHHHLIDVKSGEVIEFQNEELETLKRKIATELGYDIIGDRLELYGVRKDASAKTK